QHVVAGGDRVGAGPDRGGHAVLVLDQERVRGGVEGGGLAGDLRERRAAERREEGAGGRERRRLGGGRDRRAARRHGRRARALVRGGPVAGVRGGVGARGESERAHVGGHRTL